MTVKLYRFRVATGEALRPNVALKPTLSDPSAFSKQAKKALTVVYYARLLSKTGAPTSIFGFSLWR